MLLNKGGFSFDIEKNAQYKGVHELDDLFPLQR